MVWFLRVSQYVFVLQHFVSYVDSTCQQIILGVSAIFSLQLLYLKKRIILLEHAAMRNN